jgi:hypothetical protein
MFGKNSDHPSTQNSDAWSKSILSNRVTLCEMMDQVYQEYAVKERQSLTDMLEDRYVTTAQSAYGPKVME